MAEGDLQRTLGLNLAAYRKSQGWSQEAFAVVLGYHRTYIGGLERGERNLSLRAVERLAAALEVDVFWLLSDHTPAGEPGRRKLVRKRA